MLKLACVNCGAPLEIGPDLDAFACGYCGSHQRVERKGGIVALRKVETAIKAVQRGTDRTAAELALPRLRAELADLEATRKAALAASKERRASAIRGRRQLTLVVFSVVLIVGPIVTAAAAGSSATAATVLSLLWLVGLVAAPLFVYRKTMLPPDDSPAVAVRFDDKIGQIKVHIEANRKILDQLPE